MEPSELTYPIGAAARLTGLSPELLRAWERRYKVVSPERRPGGGRRYSGADVERLRLLKAAVDAGYRIGEIADLEAEELERRAAVPAPRPSPALRDTMAAIERLDGIEAERLISLQLAALGPGRFARDLALPLLEEIGDAWEGGTLCIASEHLASSLLRSLLGSALRPTSASMRAPVVVFATPHGERHELGLLVAALTALGAGANPLYLGADLPVDELADAVERSNAAALALGISVLERDHAEQVTREVRAAIPSRVALWLGGPMARRIELPTGAERVQALDVLERHVALLVARAQRGSS